MTEKIEQTFIMPISLAGKRLDQALAELMPDYSRSRIKQWIDSDQITVNQTPAKAKQKVVGDEIIEINAKLETEVDWFAEAIDIHIIYEDNDLIIVNKTAGMVVHPAAGNYQGTLVNALLHHCPALEKLPRAGLIHRLDKDTTGLLVIAKTLSAYKSLIEQLQARTMKREYEAIVQGEIISGGRIEEPIARHSKDRKKMTIVPTGKEAITHYRIIEKFPHFTHLYIQLETGRTHQIRVHMAHIRHPIIGDQTYGRLYFPKDAAEELKVALKHFKRQALHARQLTLTHPTTNKLIRFEAPLPNDMAALLEVIKESAA